MVRRPLSLALRLTLFFGVTSAIVFPAFGWIVIQSTERHFVTEESDELMVVADAVRELFQDNRTARDVHSLDQRFADILVGHHDASLRIAGPDGEIMYASPGPDLASIAIADRSNTAPIAEWRDDEHNYRVLSRNLELADAAGDYSLTVAVPIDHRLRFLAEFRRNLWLMIAGSVVLMSLMGWIAVRQGHAPLHDIVSRIRRLSVDQLNTRLDPDAVPGELTELAISFNEMLERVDSAFQRLSEFNEDIAHELRTPIANLMTHTQVGLSRTRTAQEYREILYSNTEEYERMAQMVADMLYLAKTESQPRPQSLTSVDLGKEVDALFEFYEGWAEERRVALKREGEATVTADRLMMQRALGNLTSNAIKNTPKGGTVTVQLSQPDRLTACVAVENPGEDIPPAHWSRLFDRFYRIDKSRQSSDQGVGLGLAIVKSIINAHLGEIAVQSGGGITRFTVSLPSQFPAAVANDV
jgi:two-component system, OmpR family, heavy metal sensor histidine kinase CusS